MARERGRSMTDMPPHFDTDAMRQILDYQPIDHGHYLEIDPKIWRVLVADHLAASEHIDELEFLLAARAAA